MSAELNAINNIMSGVKKTTGKGQAGVRKIAGSYKKAANDKARKDAAAKKKENAPSKKGQTKTTSTKKPQTKSTEDTSPKTLITPPPSNKGAEKPSTKTTKTDTFTPKSKPKYSQPSLPGMSKAKIKSL